MGGVCAGAAGTAADAAAAAAPARGGTARPGVGLRAAAARSWARHPLSSVSASPYSATTAQLQQRGGRGRGAARLGAPRPCVYLQARHSPSQV